MANIGTPALTLKVSRVFDAPRARVFAAWTREEAVKAWFAPGNAHVADARIDLRVGGTYRIHMRAADGKDWIASGTYREIRAPERLVFTWRWAHEPDAADMLVSLELIDRGGRTEVILTHENLPSEESRQAHEQGWIGCLAKLPSVL
jgi:uncharacterized protein YndB with AHSA1/START domain